MIQGTGMVTIERTNGTRHHSTTGQSGRDTDAYHIVGSRVMYTRVLLVLHSFLSVPVQPK
jgi:hypothetical protein